MTVLWRLSLTDKSLINDKNLVVIELIMSPNTLKNNKRIARNTLALYFRTFITMLVGLYTGRVMLQALGIENYGINNVVGGIVGFSGILTGSMGQGVSRFMTFSLGKDTLERQKVVFSTCVNAQIIIAIIVCLMLEVVGVWFLNYEANIPERRMVAANWVLQCSIFSLGIGLINSPFSGLIVAHEHMGIYAYMSIADVILRLSMCFAILYYGGDRLILLSLLGVLEGIGMTLFYNWYSRRCFQEARYHFKSFDKALYKEMISFSGWNLFGNSAWIFSTQGVNMLINVFFGVAFNAARGIAVTVNGAVQSFVGNFTVSFTPQITKSYAAGDIDYAVGLANKGTKFTWLLMYVFIVPVCCEADILLKLWLGTPPEWSAVFLRFAMFESLAVQFGQTLLNLIRADGRVKKYNLTVTAFAALVFPLTWFLYHLGAPVWSTYVIFIVVYGFLNIIRFITLRRLMDFSTRRFLNDCLWPCIIVSFTSFIIPLVLCYCMKPGVIRFLINVPIAVLWTTLCCTYLGLTKHEREFFIVKVKDVLVKIRR